MADQGPSRLPGVDPEHKKVRFDYIKSNSFRVVYVEGAYGGAGPRGEVQMAVYNERWPIPLQTTHELDAQGNLGQEIRAERASRDAVVREVEAELIMDVSTAKNMVAWLQELVEKIEKKRALKEGK